MTDSVNRSSRELLIATRAFAQECRWLSWWHLTSAVVILAMLLTVAASGLPWIWRVASSATAGLVIVRLFVIYHDYQHKAILRKSRPGSWLMNLFGLLVLNPPSVWNRSHDHHHRNNSRNFGMNVGSFPLLTTKQYANANRGERMAYNVVRHPMTILFGYLTTFFWGMTVRPFLKEPKEHFDCAIAIFVHCGLMVLLAMQGIDQMLLVMTLPLFIASSLGAYLFYAQHNFPAAVLVERSRWNYVDAALQSSSFMEMNWLMSWFTGNIGYHHVHHLNSRIPFYRLPEAMAALQELQSPGTTSLRPQDIFACLRLKLWCHEKKRLVGFNGE